MITHFTAAVFCESQGEAAARVFVVLLPTSDVDALDLETLRITGHIIGPECRYSSTLQAKIPLKHRGLTRVAGRTALLAEAVVPDPCYWSAELPFLYVAAGSIASPNEMRPFEQSFGIRTPAVVRRRWTLNGVTWVPRIVHRVEVEAGTPLSAWRDSATVMFVERADDALCREASLTGVLLMTEVAASGADATAEVLRLSRYPAVVIVLLKQDDLDLAELRTAGQNLLLVRLADRPLDEAMIEAFDGVMALSTADGDDWGRQWAEASRRPIVALRPLDRVVPLAEARAACDALQRDLAGQYDAAGFLV